LGFYYDMPYSVRRTFNRRRRPRAQLQWTEARVAREAIASVARRAPLYAGPNPAQRGLSLSAGEFKSVDVEDPAGVDCDTNTSVTLLNGIARGDDINERTGREVIMKSIQFTGCTYGTAGTGIDQLHRVLLVYDRQTNGAALTAAQVLSDTTPYSPRNLENRKRFKILYDRLFSINASGEAGTRRVFKFYRRLSHPITFNSGDAGDVADITSGSLYLITLGSAGVGVTAGYCSYSSRIRYQDA